MFVNIHRVQEIDSILKVSDGGVKKNSKLQHILTTLKVEIEVRLITCYRTEQWNFTILSDTQE